MKIAFSSTGNGWKENIDIKFGRSKVFFVLNTENNETKFIENASYESEHAAGTNAAKRIADENINVLITGQIGPQAREILASKGTQIFRGIAYGTLEEAYQRYNSGWLVRKT